MKCDFCNKETQVKKVQKYQYTESGLDNVFLDNVDVRFCDQCDLRSPVIPKVLTLHNTIGFAVVCKKNRLTGAEIQFLRKNLRIKSQDWAAFLRSKKETVSRWENDSQTIGLQTDLLIRFLYLRLLEERKEIRLAQSITENLSEINNEQTAIIIDVEKIESYSYLSLDEAKQLSQAKNAAITFGFEINESNNYLSVIEKPLLLPRSRIKNYRVKNSTASYGFALAA